MTDFIVYMCILVTVFCVLRIEQDTTKRHKELMEKLDAILKGMNNVDDTQDK